MYNPAFKYKKTTQSTNTIAYNCVQYTYALDDGGSTGGNAGDTLYVYSYTDYDPLGLPLAGRNFTSNAYRYGYHGQFAEYDPESGMNHFELRQYDAALGRWFVPDPYRQFHSPYNGMGNTWPNGVDPDGGGLEGWFRKVFTKAKYNLDLIKRKKAKRNYDTEWVDDPYYGMSAQEYCGATGQGHLTYSGSYNGNVYGGGYDGGGTYNPDKYKNNNNNNNNDVDGHIAHMKQQIEDGRLFPFATLQDDGEALQEQFARERNQNQFLACNGDYLGPGGGLVGFAKKYGTQSMKSAANRLNTVEESLVNNYPAQALVVFKNKELAESAMLTIFPEATHHNDEADAFRHAYWHALNARDIGKTMAFLFANAHENYSKNPYPDGSIDLYNNAIGISYGSKYFYYNNLQLMNVIYNAVINGELQKYNGIKIINTP